MGAAILVAHASFWFRTVSLTRRRRRLQRVARRLVASPNIYLSPQTKYRTAVRFTEMWGRMWGRFFADPQNRIDIKSLFRWFDSSPATTFQSIGIARTSRNPRDFPEGFRAHTAVRFRFSARHFAPIRVAIALVLFHVKHRQARARWGLTPSKTRQGLSATAPPAYPAGSPQVATLERAMSRRSGRPVVRRRAFRVADRPRRGRGRSAHRLSHLSARTDVTTRCRTGRAHRGAFRAP